MKTLKKIRLDIDKIDYQIIQLIKRRNQMVKKAGEFKRANNLPTKDLYREKEILLDRINKGQSQKISSELVKKIWQIFFKESYKLEQEI